MTDDEPGMPSRGELRNQYSDSSEADPSLNLVLAVFDPSDLRLRRNGGNHPVWLLEDDSGDYPRTVWSTRSMPSFAITLFRRIGVTVQ